MTTTFKLGDRVEWCIAPDTRKRVSLCLGEMTYARAGEVILLADIVHQMGMPISTSWCTKVESPDPEADLRVAIKLRKIYNEAYPRGLKPIAPGRAAESSEAARALRDLRAAGTAKTLTPAQYEALGLAISLLEARAEDANND